MFFQELDAIKQYFDSYLAKRTIQANLAFYSLPIFFIQKSKREIRFFVDKNLML